MNLLYLFSIFESFFSNLTVDKIAGVLKVDFHQTLVVEISEPTHHGVHFYDLVIVFKMVRRSLVKLLGEFEFPPFFIVKLFAHPELRLAPDGKVSVLLDDLFYIGCEFIVGIKLLLHETILFEVFI